MVSTTLTISMLTSGKKQSEPLALHHDVAGQPPEERHPAQDEQQHARDHHEHANDDQDAAEGLRVHGSSI